MGVGVFAIAPALNMHRSNIFFYYCSRHHVQIIHGAVVADGRSDVFGDGVRWQR